jgi:hypothetical protein
MAVIEGKLAEALDAVNKRGAETVEAKLNEVVEQARAAVEARSAKVVDDRLRVALDQARSAIESDNMAVIEGKLAEALDAVNKRGAETVDSRLAEAFEGMKRRGAETVDSRLAEAVDAVSKHGAETVDSRLAEALDAVAERGSETLEAVNKRGAETVETRIAEAIDTLTARVSETVESKLTEVIEHARATVETRGDKLIDDRLRGAVEALAARDAEALDIKLGKALEAVRARGTATVEAGLRDAFERAFRALQTQDDEEPETQGPGSSGGERPTEEEKESRPNGGRGLRSVVARRAERSMSEAPSKSRRGDDTPPIRLDPVQQERHQPEQAVRVPTQGPAEDQVETVRRERPWEAPPSAAPSQPSKPEGAGVQADAPSQRTMTQTTGGPSGKSARVDAGTKGERNPAPATPPAAAGARDSSSTTGASDRLRAPSMSFRADIGRNPARVPIGTSMLLTAGSAASLAFGWAAGEAALIWTSVASGMGAAAFLAVGHRRIAGRPRHSISQPDSTASSGHTTGPPPGHGAFGR